MSISRGDADLGETKKVGGAELMFIDFASKNEFEDLARGLLVTVLEELASGGAEDGRNRNCLGLVAIPGDFLVQRSQLRGHP